MSPASVLEGSGLVNEQMMVLKVFNTVCAVDQISTVLRSQVLYIYVAGLLRRPKLFGGRAHDAARHAGTVIMRALRRFAYFYTVGLGWPLAVGLRLSLSAAGYSRGRICGRGSAKASLLVRSVILL